LAMPFEAASFDGAYLLHVGMNIADKAGLFREVARVLKPGARLAIYDLMRTADGLLSFPVPWASTEAASFVADVKTYRESLNAAGLEVEHERGRRDFGIQFMQNVLARGAQGDSPALGLHLLMGEKAPVMVKNVLAGLMTGILEPVEMVAVKS
jgi:SAM-dependent methyltransferase